MVRQPELLDRDGRAVALVFYHFPSCPFCQRVRQRMAELALDIPDRDIHQEPEAAAELHRIGGKTQVPCLLINGQPLYESRDIIEYLAQLHRAP